MAAQVKQRDAYSGERKKQLREGFGVYNYENKFFRYEGEWEAGKKQGHGKLSMADGSYYEGEFQDGEIKGHGFRYFAMTGNTYSGEFHQGEMHGQGVMKYHNGAIYEGEWYRKGYGILRTANNEVYQGYMYDHKRHGEGTQVYSNGDRYDGDWVNDKRQGHGELLSADGSIYDGQWMADAFHGQGTYSHSSGISYEGLWVNGYPAVMADRLVIKVESPLQITQGSAFSLVVESHNEDGELVEDQGREIQISAGFRYYPPRLETEKPPEESGPGLFDVIEDVAEKPVETPFGYDIVSYPLTDLQSVEDLCREDSVLSKNVGSRTQTDLSEVSIPEGREPGVEAKQGAAQDKKEEASKTDRSESPLPQDAGITGSLTTPSASEVQPTAANQSTLPPPVTNLCTQNGQVTFEKLVLPGAPPMYRPFLALEEAEEEALKKKKRGSKTDAKKNSDDEGSRPGTRTKRENAQLGDERFCRPGEYVVMVQDVTNPAFLGLTLKPAFLLVKVILPKAVKKKRSGLSQKDKGPRWSTRQHILDSRGLAQQEAFRKDMKMQAQQFKKS